jgi:hypothetical protein
VKIPVREVKSVAKKLVDVAFSAVKLVVDAVTAAKRVVVPLVTELFVVLRFVTPRFVVVAFVATKFVVVAFVAVRLVVVSPTMLARVLQKLVAVNPVDDAVVRVLCPVTFSVPLEVRDEVAVIEPPVKVLIVLVKAFRTDEKRLVEVALVRVEFVARRFVKTTDVAPKTVVKKLVVVAFVATRLLMVALLIVVVASVLVPTTVSALPGVVVPIPRYPFASNAESFVPILLMSSNRLVVPCPAPDCTVRVVVPVVGVSFCTLKLMLLSNRFVVEFQRRIAFGVTSPRKNTSEESCASDEPLPLLTVND